MDTLEEAAADVHRNATGGSGKAVLLLTVVCKKLTGRLRV
jgi:hypothetical protein